MREKWSILLNKIGQKHQLSVHFFFIQFMWLLKKLLLGVTFKTYFYLSDKQFLSMISDLLQHCIFVRNNNDGNNWKRIKIQKNWVPNNYRFDIRVNLAVAQDCEVISISTQSPLRVLFSKSWNRSLVTWILCHYQILPIRCWGLLFRVHILVPYAFSRICIREDEKRITGWSVRSSVRMFAPFTISFILILHCFLLQAHRLNSCLRLLIFCLPIYFLMVKMSFCHYS